MALNYADRVQETSTTTGTGTYSLAGAVTGYQTFVAGIGDTNTCYYCATDGTDWEVGLGTVTDAGTDTLARTAIIASSNADSAVNWAAGTRYIYCTIPAGHADAAAWDNSTGDVLFTGDVAVGGATSATAPLTLPDGTGAAYGIAFGSDGNLYRSGANQIKTDDAFVCLEFQAGSADFTSVNSRMRDGCEFNFGSDRHFNIVRPSGVDELNINYDTTVFVTIDANGDVGIGEDSPATPLHVDGAISFNELSSDPSNPAEGTAVMWMSDGTGAGDDGDILIKITAGGSTKTATLVDFSAV